MENTSINPIWAASCKSYGEFLLGLPRKVHTNQSALLWGKPLTQEEIEDAAIHVKYGGKPPVIAQHKIVGEGEE